MASNTLSSELQACAVPFRDADGLLRFCLITSSSGRWIFPKGVVEAGNTPVKAALTEAHEEAGLHGRVIGDPIGSYEFEKKGRSQVVSAFLMEVVACDDVWDEAETRERRWATADEARRLLLGENDLLELLQAALVRIKG